MAEGRRLRKNRFKKKRSATTVLDLPDHLFEHILLRLGPSPRLVRAAAACRRWCRVVASAGFHARLISAHPHAMRVGDYHGTDRPRFDPVPSSPVNSHLFVLDDLLLDIGKDGYWWEMADSRGSLLVLATWTRSHCEALAVCEPLTRRRQGILLPQGYDFECHLGMFLVECDDAGHKLSMSNFKIILAFQQSLSFVFTPGSDGGWRLVRSEATREASRHWLMDKDNFAGRANGSIYWGIEDGDATDLLALNETTAEYSMVKFPVEIWGTYVRESCASWVLKREDGVLRIVRLLGNDLKVFAQQHRRCSEDEENIWILEKELLGLAESTIGLQGREENFFEKGASIVTANDEYILLTPILTPFRYWLFSVEVDSMRVKREHAMSKYQWTSYRCELPWPPVLPDHGSRARR